MPNKTLAPDTLSDSAPRGYGQVVVSTGSRTIYCAGQTALPKEMSDAGSLRAWDVAKQLDSALRNVGYALEAAGAGPRDLVRLNVYVVNYDPAVHRSVVHAGLKRFCDPHHLPANALIGVQSLARSEYLVEVEATAVVDD